MTNRQERRADALRSPGVRQATYARTTGTLVLVVNGTEHSVDTCDGEQPWSTICDDHGGIVSHETRALAEAWAARPDDWCPYCMGEEMP